MGCLIQIHSVRFFYFAAMAELVDALDSGSSRGNSVDVRVILAANALWRRPFRS